MNLHIWVFEGVGPTANPWFWIDLESDAVWEHSGVTATYTNWRDDEPQDDQEDCTVMYTASGYWNDVACTDEYFQYVCEKVMA